MRSYRPAVTLVVAGLFAPLAGATPPQRLYLAPQKIIITSTSKFRCHCADGDRRRAPNAGETYSGLHGDVMVSRVRKGDSKPSELPLVKAIDAQWVRLEGLGNPFFLRVVNLKAEYAVTVEVRKGSLALPTPEDLTKDERKNFEVNLAAMIAADKVAEELLRKLGGRDAEPNPIDYFYFFSPTRIAYYGELLINPPPTLLPKRQLQSELSKFAESMKPLPAEDRAVLWRLLVGKARDQAFRNFLKEENVPKSLLPPNLALNRDTAQRVDDLIQFYRMVTRTLLTRYDRYRLGIYVATMYKRSLPRRKEVSNADRLLALGKAWMWLARTYHELDCKSCDGIVGPEDILLHIDGPECFISRVTENGHRSDKWSPKSEVSQAVSRYVRDLENRGKQLLEMKADWFEQRLQNKDSDGNDLKESYDGFGYLPLLHDIVSRIPQEIKEPIVYFRASSAERVIHVMGEEKVDEIDFAFLYRLVQTAGVKGYEREVHFVRVPDSGLRAEPMRHAIENMRRQANFKDIRSVMALLLPKDQDSFNTGHTGQWLKKRTIWRSFERTKEGGLSFKEDVLKLFKELADDFLGGSEAPAFVQDPATTEEYWKRVGRAFAGHTGEGALVNVRFGHFSKGEEYLYLRDERITWSEFLRKRPTGTMPRDYIEADFRCFAGGNAEDLLVGPSAATLVISPVGEMDAVETAHFCKAYLGALKKTSPAKAHGQAWREYLKDLRRRLEDKKVNLQHRYQIEKPRLQGRRPHPANLGHNDWAA